MLDNGNYIIMVWFLFNFSTLHNKKFGNYSLEVYSDALPKNIELKKINGPQYKSMESIQNNLNI